ncbi:hypothetical protein AB0I22_30865 [Streptomyces sp. NPDC050610]|uniref:hypothetical protein n=1 Tax=Streptomyces sp. NPDC050610 TaxID=3157097 RepID=UPI0034215E47
MASATGAQSSAARAGQAARDAGKDAKAAAQAASEARSIATVKRQQEQAAAAAAAARLARENAQKGTDPANTPANDSIRVINQSADAPADTGDWIAARSQTATWANLAPVGAAFTAKTEAAGPSNPRTRLIDLGFGIIASHLSTYIPPIAGWLWERGKDVWDFAKDQAKSWKRTVPWLGGKWDWGL